MDIRVVSTVSGEDPYPLSSKEVKKIPNSHPEDSFLKESSFLNDSYTC